MNTLTKKSFTQPDESKTPDQLITNETITVDGHKVIKITTQPGWVWTKHMKPIVETDLCQMDHLLFMISGRVAAKMDDGAELVFGPGEVGHIPPGHDGWTVGDEPAVWLELPH